MGKVSVIVVLVVVMVVIIQEAAADPHRGRGYAFAGGYAVGHHRGHHHGCHSCYGRRKRSLDQMMDREELENLYWKIASQDEDQCGLRLVCELAQKDANTLTGDEMQILYPYFGRGDDTETYFGQYDKAVWHGHQGSVCHAQYPLCALPAPQIMASDFDHLNMADYITSD